MLSVNIKKKKKVIKRQEETSGGDGYVHGTDCGDNSFIDVNHSSNSSSCIHLIYTTFVYKSYLNKVVYKKYKIKIRIKIMYNI